MPTTTSATSSSVLKANAKSDDDCYDDMMDSKAEFDPRVQIELEALNQSATDINRLEKEIEEAHSKYQSTFSDCFQQLEVLKRKYGTSIKKARTYYEIKENAKEAQREALWSARKFQSANGVYLAAKETIALAELRLMDDKAANLSSAWQEMLNHALLRVTEAEKEKSISEKEHLKRAAVFADMENKLHLLEKKTKRSISKARPYFESKKELEVKLQQLKQSVEDLQQALRGAKHRYAGALKHLENISDGIHEKRQQKLLFMFPREPGVGAEENVISSEFEHKIHTLSGVNEVEGHEYLQDDNDDDSTFYDESSDEDEGHNDINNESVFRDKVLTTSLDDEDTSFMKGTERRKSHKKKPLKRSQSLPVYAGPRPTNKSVGSPQESSLDSELSSTEDVFRKPLVPLSDRADSYPPDGDSLSSEKNYACDQASQNSISAENATNNVQSQLPTYSETPAESPCCKLSDTSFDHKEELQTQT